MRRGTLVAAALALLLSAAAPAIGNFHEVTPSPPDRAYVLLMRGTTFNGLTAPQTPLLEASLGEIVEFAVHVPLLAEPHTFHLHGHPWFSAEEGRVIDTRLVEPGQTYRFRVVAGGVDEHAGDWLYHCHVGQHMERGMWGIFRVYPFDVGILPTASSSYEVRLDRLGEPVTDATIEARLGDVPVPVHAQETRPGTYAVHVDAPAAAKGTLVLTATHASLGLSVGRVGPPGAAPDAPVLLAHHG